VNGEEKKCTQGFGGETRGEKPLGGPVVDGKIILRCIFKKWNVAVWTMSNWFRIGRVGVHLGMR
jgi:hypothetical protein